MLLHKLYINTAIRYILVYQNCFYDLPGGNAKNHGSYDLRRAKKPFFGHISENKNFKVYVA